MTKHETSKPPRLDKRWQTRYPARMALAAGLLGALIGGGATAYTNDKSVNAQQKAQREQFREQRENEARKVRAKVYVDYLAAAENFRSAVLLLDNCMYGSAFEDKPLEGVGVVGCPNALPEVQKQTRHLFKEEHNISIYGSTEAIALARQLIDIAGEYMLHWQSYGKASSRKQVSEIYSTLGRIDDRYRTRSDEFRVQMCKDLNPIPRSGCR